MMIQINRENLEEQVCNALPELEPNYQKAVRTTGDGKKLGNYLVFGLVLKPLLKEQLAKGHRTEFLQRVADFLEAVCISGDPEAINVVWLEVFQWVLPDVEQLTCLWMVLGDTTKKQIRDAALRWGFTKNLPN